MLKDTLIILEEARFQELPQGFRICSDFILAVKSDRAHPTNAKPMLADVLHSTGNSSLTRSV
jgi:hypothetical protein